MKLTSDHVAILRTAIEPLDTEQVRESYRTGNFPRSNKVKDLDKRYRWDLLWASKAMSKLYATDYKNDYTDEHIDTALRSIVQPLN